MRKYAKLSSKYKHVRDLYMFNLDYFCVYLCKLKGKNPMSFAYMDISNPDFSHNSCEVIRMGGFRE